MSEILTPEEFFRSITTGLLPNYWGRDPYGTDCWEYQLNETEMAAANEVLVEHSLEPADTIYFARQSEFTELSGNEIFSLAQETTSISLHDGRFIRFYSFAKYDDADEVFARKDTQIENDNTDLVNTLLAAMSGNRELSDYRDEVHQISHPELLALSALTRILLERDTNEGE